MVQLTEIFFISISILLPNLSLSQEKDIQPVIEWGGMDVSEGQMISSITDFIISGKDEIVVADSKSNELIFFDKKGKITSRIGRKGKGPLEFGGPYSIMQLGDSLWIWEIDNSRFQCLTLDGAFESFHYPKVDLLMSSMCFDSQGRVYYSTNGFRSGYLIKVFDFQRGEIAQFGEIEGKSFDMYQFDEMKRYIKKGDIPPQARNSILLQIDSKGEIIAVHKSLPLIKKFAPDGKEIFRQEIKLNKFREIIAEAVNKNRNLPSAGVWIPTFWQDIALDENEGFYLLLKGKGTHIYHFNNVGVIIEMLNYEDETINNIFVHGQELWGASKEDLRFFCFELDNMKD